LQLLQRQLPHKLHIREQNLFKNFKKDPSAPITKLKRLYAFLDDLYEFVNKYTPCKIGCSACCYIPVSISGLEIEYIEQTSGIKRISGQTMAFSELQVCPFLENNSCGIYKERPFVCRRHITLDKNSRWCQIDVCQMIELPLLRFSEVEKTYEQIVHDSRLAKWIDIREIFRKAAYFYRGADLQSPLT
jgi:Fe-S-cluster containining protein